MSALGIVPHDGYTLTGVLNKVPNLYPGVQFDFRPMTGEEFSQHLHDSQTLTEPESNRFICAHLVGRVLTWDLKGPKGDAVDITLDNMARLLRPLFLRLWRVVAGLEGPDQLMNQARADAAAALEDKIRAAATRRPLPEVREEREAKN